MIERGPAMNNQDSHEGLSKRGFAKRAVPGGLLRHIRHLFTPVVLLLMTYCAGCGTVHVTSDPPGAVVQRTCLKPPAPGTPDPNSIAYGGITPCRFMRVYRIDAVRVVWSDGTRSEWQMTPFDLWGSRSFRLHFVKWP